MVPNSSHSKINFNHGVIQIKNIFNNINTMKMHTNLSYFSVGA